MKGAGSFQMAVSGSKLFLTALLASSGTVSNPD